VNAPQEQSWREPSTISIVILVGLVAAATIAAVILSDGNLVAAVAPVGAFGLLYLLWHLPMRYPVLVLLFLGLTLENPGDDTASGLWKSPLYPLGALLLAHWNLTFPVKALFFSGMDLLLVFFFGLALYRRMARSPLDREGYVETASPMRFFSALTIFGALFLELWGMARGGMDFASSLWQVQRVIYLPLLFFLFHFALRGPKDQAAVGKAIILAACGRAMAAWGIRHFVTPNSIDEMPTATSHPDSMLFAGAFCLCVVLFVEIPSRKHALLGITVLPILVLGMIANNRRLVWVEIALALMVLFFVMPMTRMKRKIVRYALIAAPLVMLYVAIGWNKAGGVFRGAQMVRSIIDSKSDASTEWRDLENYDLFFTLKSSPLVGVGYGHPYLEPIKLPDVTQFYALEHFIPHNSILGLWAFGGLVGFSLLWMLMVVGAFFAARSYKLAKRPIDRVAALASTLMFVIYLAHCYGDLALGTWASVFLVAAAFAVVGKLALTTGAWPSRRKVGAA
jgi:O-antigen ligase